MDKNEKSPFMVALGKRVLDRRKELKLNQETVAEQAGISAQFLSFIESGKQSIRAENIVNLAKALNVSTDYLLTGVCNHEDTSRVNQLLQSLNSEQLLVAEHFFKTLQDVCDCCLEDPKNYKK